MSKTKKPKIPKLTAIYFNQWWKPLPPQYKVKYKNIFGDIKCARFHNEEDAITFALHFKGMIFFKTFKVGDYR